jgi:aspartate aminotransferase
MHPEISSRARSMPASPIRKLAAFADDARQRGRHVYHLNIGQPDLETPAAIRDRLHKLEDKVLAYSPSGGTPAFVDAMRTYYGRLGITLDRNEILTTTGGSEAILFAMMAVSNPGDEGLLAEPFYTNYIAFATMASLRLVPVTTHGENGFHLPPRDVWEKALTPKTKFVLVCNPNNPTGTVYRPEEIEMMAAFCRDHGIFLIVDEVYREFVYDGRKAVSALTLDDYRDHVIVVDSLSKRFSACGIRLGCLVTRNRDVFDAAMCMAQGRLSPPGVAQFISVGAAELGPDYYAGIIREYQKRRDLLFEELSAIPGVFLRKPEGAFYLVARLPVDDAEAFARWLVSEFDVDGKTVLITPAAGFYATKGLGKNEARLAYVLNSDDLRVAVRIIRAGLEKYPARTREAVAAK